MLGHSSKANGNRLQSARALWAGYPGKEIKQSSFFEILCFDEHSFYNLIIHFRGVEKGR